MFEAAGIGYSLPVAGVSEIGTSLICTRHKLGRIHQSCIKGKNKPCFNCWKCYRKRCCSIDNWQPDYDDFDFLERIVNSREVMARIFDDRPIKHEGVLTYCLTNHKSNDRVELLELKKLVRAGEIDTQWMERWYSESTGLIDEEYRQEVVTNLENILGVMNDANESELKKWENAHSDEREQTLRRLEDVLNTVQ